MSVLTDWCMYWWNDFLCVVVRGITINLFFMCCWVLSVLCLLIGPNGRGFASCVWNDFPDHMVRRGWSQLCYSRDRVINHQFRFGEISPVVCDMTSSTRWFEGWPQILFTWSLSMAGMILYDRARFRQLFVTWLPRPDMDQRTRGMTTNVFTWGSLITGKALPGRDFAS